MINLDTDNLNQADLSRLVALRAGVDEETVYHVLSVFMDTVVSEVTAGKNVKLTNFGTFRSSLRAARTGRNPQNGDPVEIPARRWMLFHTSEKVQKIVNSGDVCAKRRKEGHG